MSDAPIIIVGAGIAGLSVALRMAPHPVTVLTGAPLGEGAATAWAQGGIAAALGDDDSAFLHAEDTLKAGAGLVEPDAAALLAQHAGAQIEWLEKLGVRFDRDAGGALRLGREAAHARNRIVHAGGDSTGAVVMQALIRMALQTPSIHFHVGGRAVDLRVEEGAVTGLYLNTNGAVSFMPARAVVLATGGIGQLYAHTTNPPSAWGEGLAMAARAGATLRDLEFVQFHPTALVIGADPMPLLTEALRGEGAVLVNETGARFMLDVHDAAELAPRDVVARAIWRQLQEGHTPMLDASKAIGRHFAEKFPFIYETCRKAGFDPATAPVPVAPAAHYHMGGIQADASGRASLGNLWVCGEAASTGVHGANRLASNSLLEALVYAEIIAGDLNSLPPAAAAAAPRLLPPSMPCQDDASLRHDLRRLMYADCGLLRDAQGLRRVIGSAFSHAGQPASAGMDAMLLVAGMIAFMALQRRESRGAHTRRDFAQAAPQPLHQTLTFAQFDNALYELHGKNWPSPFGTARRGTA